MADYVTLQDAVDGLRADNQALTDEVLAGNTTATTAKADAEAARVAAELAETNAKESETLSLTYKDSAEAAVPLAEQHKLDAEAQVPLAQAEKVAAEAARDTAVLTSLGPDNDKLASIASVYSQPSLNLDFAKQEFWKQGTYPWNQETLDPAVDLTFTRASTATYWDANGVLQTAAADEMRFDHDPVTGEPLGVLIEPSATNLVPQSTDLSLWTQHNVETTLDGPPLVNGLASSKVSLIEPGVRSGVRVTGLTNTEANYCTGVFLKAGSATHAIVSATGSANYARHAVEIDLVTGEVVGTQEDTIVTSGPVQVTPVGSGWFHVSMVSTLNTASRSISISPSNGQGVETLVSSGGSGGIYGLPGSAATEGLEAGDYVYVAGVQLETGSVATSYIPTNGAPVTRAADVAYVDLDALINMKEGTILSDCVWLTPNIGTGTKSLFLGLGAPNLTSVIAYDWTFIRANDFYSRTGEGYEYLPPNTGVLSRRGYAYTQDSHTVAWEGNTRKRDSRELRSDASRLTFSLGVWSGHIKNARYYPRAMTEAELIELTALPEEPAS